MKKPKRPEIVFTAGAGTDETTPQVFSTGELLAEGSFDLIRVASSPGPDYLAFAIYDGNGFTVRREVTVDGVTYTPPPLDTELAAAMRLPSEPIPFTSAKALFEDLREAITSRVPISAADASLAACFGMATWVGDRLPFVPPLAVSGPAEEANQLLRVLSWMCRRALPLAYLDAAGFLSLPMRWQPTLLFGDFDMSARLSALLRSSNAPGRAISSRGRVRPGFCAKAFYAGDRCDLSFFQQAIRVTVDPGLGVTPWLPFETEQVLIGKFQSQLLAWRLTTARTISRPDIRDTKLGGDLRLVAAVLAACLAGTDLGQAVPDWLQRQDLSQQATVLVDQEAVVIEAGLMACHEKRDQVRPGELAEIATLILQGRGERVELSGKRVGNLLRSFGIESAGRQGAGMEIVLSLDVRRRFHLLGRLRQVASCRYSGPCPQCGIDLDSAQ